MVRLKDTVPVIWHLLESFLVEVVCLVFAASVLFAHTQAIWYRQSEVGWREAIRMEFVIASPVIVGAIVALVFAGIVESRRIKKAR